MDSEKVEKNLSECIEYIRKHKFNKIPCWGNCQSAMMDALALLKEQPEIVRCKDCQFHYAGENEVDAWDRCRLHSINTEPDNYCSWAVKNGQTSETERLQSNCN